MAHLAQVKEIARAARHWLSGPWHDPELEPSRDPDDAEGPLSDHDGLYAQSRDHGLDMMYRTCTVQANLDYADEADMVKKLQVGLALQPVVTAMFANSPFTEGRPNGFLSFRSEIWRDTDPDRTGMLPWAFEAGMGFERYVDYALDVPMYFIKRGEQYIDVAGQSFRDLMQGAFRDAGRARNALGLGEPYLDDLSGGPSQALSGNARSGRRAVAAASCAAGLLGRILYDDVALDAAWDLVKGWTAEQRQLLRDQVPKLGFAAEIAGRKVVDLARITIALAQQGLARRQRLDAAGEDESRYLEPIQYYVERGITPAEDLLSKYAGEWKRSLAPVFEEYAY